MKKRILLFIMSILLCACNTKTAENQSLKIYVDGVRFADTYALVSGFQKIYPDIEIEVELLPQVKIFYGSDGMPKVDTDELAEREAVLQQHRTALMAGQSDGDLYLISGGSSQYHELNGGALIQNPYDLMSNGVLADMSALLSEVDKEDYLNGMFEVGQKDGKQYLVPLQIAAFGFVVNGVSEFEKQESREEQQDYLLTNYSNELSNLTGLCNMQVSALSYPVVDKEKNKIYLKDENYQEAFAMAKTFYKQMAEQTFSGIYYGEMISQGTTILSSATNPILSYRAVLAELIRYDLNANLEFVPLLNEKNGVTVEASVFAFSPVSSENTDAAVLFLTWLLGEEVQSGNIEVFSTSYYPVRKGCGQSQLVYYEMAPEIVGESAGESLEVFEAMVSDVKFISRYDYDLLYGMRQWQTGELDLDTIIEDLYEEWSLYLDE